jgi:hypothetical protein
MVNTNNSKRRKRACPDGYKLRSSYTRKISNSVLKQGYRVRRGSNQYYIAKPEQQEVHVPAKCMKNTKRISQGVGKYRKGDLIKYGYSYRGSDTSRHEALKRAEKAYGSLSLYHKLDAIAKLSTKHSDIQQVFQADRDWVRTMLMKK